MNWYPFRDIGGVKKANLDAAVNLEVANGQAKVGFYTTSAHSAARVRVEAAGEGSARGDRGHRSRQAVRKEDPGARRDR